MALGRLGELSAVNSPNVRLPSKLLAPQPTAERFVEQYVDDDVGTSCPRCLRDGRIESIFHGYHGHAQHGCVCRRCTREYRKRTGETVESEHVEMEPLGRLCPCSICAEAREQFRLANGLPRPEQRKRRKAKYVDGVSLRDREIQARTSQGLSVDLQKPMPKSFRDRLLSIVRHRFPNALDPTGYYVYLLWEGKNDTPLYIGQSTNILSRLGAHMNNPEKRSRTSRVQLIKCENKDAMDDLEMNLIRLFQPTLNIQGK